MSPWKILGLLVLSVTIVQALPPTDVSSSIVPTTCSGAVFAPSYGGTYNVSLYDPCTKATHTTLVTVKCPERIPAANFTLVSPNKVGNTILLKGSVCTWYNGAKFDHEWIRIRNPDSNVTYTIASTGGSSSSQMSEIVSAIGYHQYSWVVFDGCQRYAYDIGVYYDGTNQYVLPAGAENYWVENANCVGDQRQVKLEAKNREMVYRVFYPDQSFSAAGTAQTTGGFDTLIFLAESSIKTGPNMRAPVRLGSTFQWNVTSSSGKVLIRKIANAGDQLDFFFASPEHLQDVHNETVGETPLGVSWDWVEVSTPGVAGPHATEAKAYPPNRANATFNTLAVTVREVAQWSYRAENYTNTRVRRIWADLSHAKWTNVPNCRIRVTGATTTRVTVQARPYVGNVASTDYSICLGQYDLTVNVSSGPEQAGCWSTATQNFDINCGFTPEIYWSEANAKTAAYPHIAGVIPLAALSYDPLQRPLTRFAEILQKPTGSVAEVTANDGGALLTPDLPGLYRVNMSVTNGCSRSAWVTEYVHVYCPQDVPYAPTFDPLPENLVFTGTPIVLTLSGSGLSPAVTQPTLVYTVQPNTGPTGGLFADDKLADYITRLSVTTTRFEPRGAGAWAVQLRSTHGCGQFSETRVQQIQITCGNPTPFTLPASWTRTATSTDGNWPRHYFDVSEGSAYALPAAPSGSLRLRHTWRLPTGEKFRTTPLYTTPFTNSDAFFTPNRTGRFIFQYYVDDSCSQASNTYELDVVCPNPPAIFVQTSSNPLYLNSTVGFSFTSSHTLAKAEFTCVKQGTTTQFPVDVSGSGSYVSVYPYQTGDYVITARWTSVCGGSSEATLTFTVVDRPACQPIAFNLVAHTRTAEMTLLEPVTSTFDNKQFSAIIFNATGSTFGSTPLGSVTFRAYVVSAPAHSMFANRTSVFKDPTTGTIPLVGVPSAGYVTYYDSKVTTTTSETLLLHLMNSQQLATAFVPDVAGLYTVRMYLDNGCTKEWKDVQVTAGCPAGAAPLVVIDNEKGQQLSSSTQYAVGQIPGVGVTITYTGNEVLTLNASRSTVNGKSAGLYYHWYWQSPEKDDHSGLLTPYAPVLLLNPKNYLFNNRPLFVTVSDGCSNVTAAVRVNSQCAGPSVSLRADKSMINVDRLGTCDAVFKLDAGICIDHKQWTARTTYPPAKVTAQSAFLSAFPAQSDSSSDHKLAIGLGVGLGLVGLIGIVALSVVGFKKGWCARRGGSTSNKSSTGIEL